MTLRVWITGASSGLGAALARYYDAQGATLGLVARRETPLRALAAQLKSSPYIYPLDVTDGPALAAASRAFMAQVGVPHIVIANAGISVDTLTEEVDDLAAFARVFAVNVQGVVNTFHPFVEPMRQRRSTRSDLFGPKGVSIDGRLVGIGSVAGVRGLPGAGAYAASKAAVATYMESLRIELRGSGVKAVTVAPGFIATPMTAVNEYAMPFMLSADVAARRIARVIERGSSYAVVPWQMGVVGKLMRMLPDGIYDRLASEAKRKPRGLPL